MLRVFVVRRAEASSPRTPIDAEGEVHLPSATVPHRDRAAVPEKVARTNRFIKNEDRILRDMTQN